MGTEGRTAAGVVVDGSLGQEDWDIEDTGWGEAVGDVDCRRSNATWIDVLRFARIEKRDRRADENRDRFHHRGVFGTRTLFLARKVYFQPPGGMGKVGSS